jgi:hypothetical protein
MNWYTLFYLMSVADSLKSFFATSSTIFTILALLSGVAFVITRIAYSAEVGKYGDKDKDAQGLRIASTTVGRLFYTMLTLCLLTWFGYVALPSKKDALIIIAGGTVGNFIQNDSSASKVPSEVMNLLRSKIRSEITELELQTIAEKAQIDTLETKTKEELIQLIQNKKGS